MIEHTFAFCTALGNTTFICCYLWIERSTCRFRVFSTDRMWGSPSEVEASDRSKTRNVSSFSYSYYTTYNSVLNRWLSMDRQFNSMAIEGG